LTGGESSKSQLPGQGRLAPFQVNELDKPYTHHENGRINYETGFTGDTGRLLADGRRALRRRHHADQGDHPASETLAAAALAPLRRGGHQPARLRHPGGGPEEKVRAAAGPESGERPAADPRHSGAAAGTRGGRGNRDDHGCRPGPETASPRGAGGRGRIPDRACPGAGGPGPAAQHRCAAHLQREGRAWYHQP